MTEFYSPSRGGFFDDQINRTIPDDCVPLKPGQRQALHAALATGKIIRVTANGAVQAVAPTPPAIDDRRAQLHTAVKREASRRILAIAPMWQQVNDLRAIAEANDATARAAGTLIAEEIAEAALKAYDRGAAIDAVRTASNMLDAAIDTMSVRVLTQLDVTSAGHWPPDKPEPAPEAAPTPETAS